MDWRKAILENYASNGLCCTKLQALKSRGIEGQAC